MHIEKLTTAIIEQELTSLVDRALENGKLYCHFFSRTLLRPYFFSIRPPMHGTVHGLVNIITCCFGK